VRAAVADTSMFTITSFATVGYGDIYACTSGSRRTVVAELSNVGLCGYTPP
jgi:hypothetical protein